MTNVRAIFKLIQQHLQELVDAAGSKWHTDVTEQSAVLYKAQRFADMLLLDTIYEAVFIEIPGRGIEIKAVPRSFTVAPRQRIAGKHTHDNGIVLHDLAVQAEDIREAELRKERDAWLKEEMEKSTTPPLGMPLMDGLRQFTSWLEAQARKMITICRTSKDLKERESLNDKLEDELHRVMERTGIKVAVMLESQDFVGYTGRARYRLYFGDNLMEAEDGKHKEA